MSLLHIVLSKHKNPNVISEASKKLFMKFPEGGPIISDSGKDKAYWRRPDDVPNDQFAVVDNDDTDVF